MISITEYRKYWLGMGARLADFDVTIFARTEEELSKKINAIDDGALILVAVIPSADTIALDLDTISEIETGIIYSLVKVSRNNQNEKDEVDAMDSTQIQITGIKNMLLWDATHCESEWHEMISRINFNKMHTDPEYSLFGCDGYSLSFQFLTAGF